MKILFDNQIFTHQKYGGISRYFSELFFYFKIINSNFNLPINDTQNEYLLSNIIFKNKNLYNNYEKNFYNNFKIKNNKLKYLLKKIFIFLDKKSNYNLNIKELKKQDFDIFHPTYFNPYFLKYLKNKKFVLTIYDLNYHKFPEFFKDDNGKINKRIQLLANRADKIIAISKNTKNDIIKYYNIPDNKIEVIYLANSLKKRLTDINFLPKKYILFVGSRGTYKNFNFFIESIASLFKNDNNLYLVASGGGLFNSNELNLLEKLNIKNRVIQYSATDNELSTLYSKALCFVFPSLSEGFGLPILEAFSCDCPVLCSNTSSLPEVAEDAALYFNPEDKNDILYKVNYIIDDKNLREELIKKGKLQLKKFSWKKTAEETINVYKSILN